MSSFSPHDLKIAGLVPFSTVDWPGKISASLFLQGCPWRCPYCHNAEILDPRAPGAVTWQSVTELLDKRVGLLDGVVFSGGEALMQGSSSASSTLAAAMAEVRRRGYQVGLHTGGAFPKHLESLLDLDLIDWVGLDIKAMPDSYELATGSSIAAQRAEESLAVLADYDAARGVDQGRTPVPFDWEVRLTLWPALAGSDPNSPGAVLDYAQNVGRWARERGARNFALQRYRAPSSGITNVSTPDLALLDEGPAWDEQLARDLLDEIGFSTVAVR